MNQVMFAVSSLDVSTIKKHQHISCPHDSWNNLVKALWSLKQNTTFTLFTFKDTSGVRNLRAMYFNLQSKIRAQTNQDHSSKQMHTKPPT